MGGHSNRLQTSLIYLIIMQALSVILQMTSSAFFMKRPILILNIAIRISIIIAGLLIELNVMNLSQSQLDSVQWIGRLMIGFGILRLAWFVYQVMYNPPSSELEKHDEN